MFVYPSSELKIVVDELDYGRRLPIVAGVAFPVRD